jgi:hypothetical protein
MEIEHQHMVTQQSTPIVPSNRPSGRCTLGVAKYTGAFVASIVPPKPSLSDNPAIISTPPIHGIGDRP